MFPTKLSMPDVGFTQCGCFVSPRTASLESGSSLESLGLLPYILNVAPVLETDGSQFGYIDICGRIDGQCKDDLNSLHSLNQQQASKDGC